MPAKKALQSSSCQSSKRRWRQIILFVGFFSFFIFYCFFPRIPLPTSNSPLVFYSSEHGHPLRNVTEKALATAKNSIYLRVFGLTDHRILKLLAKKAKCSKTILEYDCKGGLPEIAIAGMKGFTGSRLLHEKILIIDNTLSFAGSLNFTSSSFDLHQNLWVGFYSPELACHLLDRAQIFFTMKLQDQTLECYRMPKAGAFAKKKLYSAIEQAHQSITVCAFALTDPILLAKLVEKQQKGLKVECFFDQHLVTKAIKDSNLLYAVHSANLGLMHHKWLIVDENILFFGSANFSESAFTKNEDILFVISDLQEDQVKFFNTIAARLRKARSKKKSSVH